MLRLLERFRQPVLLEEYLPGREFGLGLIGNPGLDILDLEAVAEIVPNTRRSETIVEHVRSRIAQQLCGDITEQGVLFWSAIYIPVVVAMAANPYAIPLMWDWYVSNLKEIEKFHPLLYERAIAAIIPTAGIKRADEVKAFYSDYMKKSDKAKDIIKLSLERLEINMRMRNHSQ